MARTTAYRLAKEFQEQAKSKEASMKRVDNKFTIKTNKNTSIGNKVSNQNGRPSVAGSKAVNSVNSNKKVTSMTSINNGEKNGEKNPNQIEGKYS